jgi:Thioredoxin like C-terminal domain
MAGEWSIGRERVLLEEPGGSIAIRFHARDMHLVLSAEAAKPVSFRVSLDGRPPGTSHGADVDADGRGLLEHGRLYQLIRQHGEVADRTAEITFTGPGAGAYVFTFG